MNERGLQLLLGLILILIFTNALSIFFTYEQLNEDPAKVEPEFQDSSVRVAAPMAVLTAGLDKKMYENPQPQVIDGVKLQDGDRVWLANEQEEEKRGIYVYDDYNYEKVQDVRKGQTISVQEGNSFALRQVTNLGDRYDELWLGKIKFEEAGPNEYLHMDSNMNLVWSRVISSAEFAALEANIIGLKNVGGALFVLNQNEIDQIVKIGENKIVNDSWRSVSELPDSFTLDMWQRLSKSDSDLTSSGQLSLAVASLSDGKHTRPAVNSTLGGLISFDNFTIQPENATLLLSGDSASTVTFDMKGVSSSNVIADTFNGLSISTLQSNVNSINDNFVGVTNANVTSVANIGATTISANDWESVSNMPAITAAQWDYIRDFQDVSTGASPTFDGGVVDLTIGSSSQNGKWQGFGTSEEGGHLFFNGTPTVRFDTASGLFRMGLLGEQGTAILSNGNMTTPYLISSIDGLSLTAQNWNYLGLLTQSISTDSDIGISNVTSDVTDIEGHLLTVGISSEGSIRQNLGSAQVDAPWFLSPQGWTSSGGGSFIWESKQVKLFLDESHHKKRKLELQAFVDNDHQFTGFGSSATEFFVQKKGIPEDFKFFISGRLVLDISVENVLFGARDGVRGGEIRLEGATTTSYLFTDFNNMFLDMAYPTDVTIEFSNSGAGNFNWYLNSYIRQMDSLMFDTVTWSSLHAIDAVTLSNAVWSRIATLQDFQTTSSPTFTGFTGGAVTVTGSITIESIDYRSLSTNISNAATELANISTATTTELKKIDVSISSTQWQRLEASQSVGTSDSVQFVGGTLTGNLNLTGDGITTGLVNGLDFNVMNTDLTEYLDKGWGGASDDVVSSLQNMGATTITAAQWGYLDTNQIFTSGANVIYNNIVINGNLNISPGGTVDGISIAQLFSDLENFEDALRNLTASEIIQIRNMGDGEDPLTWSISATNWDTISKLDQDISSGQNVEFSNVTANNIVTSTQIWHGGNSTTSMNVYQTSFSSLQEHKTGRAGGNYASGNTGSTYLFQMKFSFVDTYNQSLCGHYRFTADQWVDGGFLFGSQTIDYWHFDTSGRIHFYDMDELIRRTLTNKQIYNMKVLQGDVDRLSKPVLPDFINGVDYQSVEGLSWRYYIFPRYTGTKTYRTLDVTTAVQGLVGVSYSYEYDDIMVTGSRFDALRIKAVAETITKVSIPDPFYTSSDIQSSLNYAGCFAKDGNLFMGMNGRLSSVTLEPGKYVTIGGVWMSTSNLNNWGASDAADFAEDNTVGLVYHPLHNRLYLVPKGKVNANGDYLLWYIEPDTKDVNYVNFGTNSNFSFASECGAYDPVNNKMLFCSFNTLKVTDPNGGTGVDNIETFAVGDNFSYGVTAMVLDPVNLRYYFLAFTPGANTLKYYDLRTQTVQSVFTSRTWGYSGGGAYVPSERRIYIAPRYSPNFPTPDGSSNSSTWFYIDCTTNDIGSYSVDNLVIGPRSYGSCIYVHHVGKLFMIQYGGDGSDGTHKFLVFDFNLPTLMKSDMILPKETIMQSTYLQMG